VRWILTDRRAEEPSGEWAARMAGIETDAVIDLICYTPEQNRTMIEAFRGRVSHFLHCGTLWVYGACRRVPSPETAARNPIGDYGKQKSRIETDLIAEFRQSGFPATVLHPGHISGRNWLPIDPQGTRNGIEVYRRLARGEEICLPDLGLATLHHVHADDVAQLFQNAIEHRAAALGNSFNVAAPHAMTLVGCCEAVAGLFGREPKLCFVPMAELADRMEKEAYEGTVAHVEHSTCADISRARSLLDYAPRYTTEQIYAECLECLLETGQLAIK